MKIFKMIGNGIDTVAATLADIFDDDFYKGAVIGATIGVTIGAVSLIIENHKKD